MSSLPPSAAFLDESRIARIYAASTATIVLSSVFFVGRLASKRITRLPLNASDYVLIFSLLCCWGLAIVNIWMTKVGLGRHLAWLQEDDPSLSKLKQLLMAVLADELLYSPGIGSVKISILLFYKDVFGIDKKFNLAANVLVAIVSAWVLGNLLPSIFACRPVSSFWNLEPSTECINKTAFYISGSSINIATDIAILCLPLNKICHLRLSWRRKIELVGAFLLGGLVCVVSVYRFTVLFSANSPDIPWEFATVLSWSAIEVSVAITSACLPLMRPLLFAVLSCSWSCSFRASPTYIDDRTAQTEPSKGAAPRLMTTFGSTKIPLPLITHRNQAISQARSIDRPNFESLENQTFLTSAGSHQSVVTEPYRNLPEPCSVEHERPVDTTNGIVVTSSIEVSTSS